METLKERHARFLKALKAVEEWWLTRGTHQFHGAPACIFAVRQLIREEVLDPPVPEPELKSTEVIKRYSLDYHGSHGEDAYMAEDPDGEWVKVKDVARLQARLELETATTSSLAKDVVELSARQGMTVEQVNLVIDLMDAKINEFAARDSSDGGLVENIKTRKIESDLMATVEGGDE